MLYPKINPVGRDVIIHELQNSLYNGLVSIWGDKLDSYSRCYILSKDGKKTIENYEDNSEYSRNLIVAEKNKFFFTSEYDLKTYGSGRYYETKLDLYYIVNVSELKPLITNHRADEEVMVDVINQIYKLSDLVDIDSVISDIDKVFANFNYDYKDDLQPNKVFKIVLNVKPFDLNKINCINN